MQKQPQRRNIITMTVKTATKQLFFTVILMFFVSHSPRFGIQETKRNQRPTHQKRCWFFIIAWMGAKSCRVADCELSQLQQPAFKLGQNTWFKTWGTFYSDAAEDFTAGLPVWLADQGKDKNRINSNRFLCHIYCKLLSIWMASWWQFG